MPERRDRQHHTAVRLAGVDGCRAGWVVAAATVGSRQRVLKPRIRVAATLADAVARTDMALVDVPIGLLDAAEPGGRPCDRLARRLLGPRGASVFSPPVRAVLAARTYRDALRASRVSSPHGLGLSKQTWNITPKIREADAWITPARQRRVRECHPEAAFAALVARASGDAAASLASKRSAAGRASRLGLLTDAGVRMPLRGEAPIRVDGAQPDDVLDAVACLTAAVRRWRGDGTVLGGERDGRGLRMEILY